MKYCVAIHRFLSRSTGLKLLTRVPTARSHSRVPFQFYRTTLDKIIGISQVNTNTDMVEKDRELGYAVEELLCNVFCLGSKNIITPNSKITFMVLVMKAIFLPIGI